MALCPGPDNLLPARLCMALHQLQTSWQVTLRIRTQGHMLRASFFLGCLETRTPRLSLSSFWCRVPSLALGSPDFLTIPENLQPGS